MLEVVLFYNGLDVPTRQILDSRGAIPSKTVVDAKVAIQEMAEYSQKCHNGTSRTKSTETSEGLAAIQAQLNNLRREIKKVNEKVYAAQVGCEQSTAPGFYQKNNASPSYQERRISMEETLSKFMSESAKRHEDNSNLIKEIRASTDATIRNQGALIKTLEIQIRQMSKVLQERGFGSLPSSTKTNPRDHVKSISTIVEADSYPIRRMGSSQYAISAEQNRTLMYETKQMIIPFPSHLNSYYYEEKKGSCRPQFSEAYSEASHINNSIPRKEKDLGSFTLPCFINNVCFDNALADLGASVSVMPLSTYLNLGLGELAHTKLTIELADRTLRRNQVDDLMPTIEEGEVVEEFRARNDDRMVSKVFEYHSDCDYDKKIRMDYAYNLKFSCMIDFGVLEDMDTYHDKGMGDVIFGKPFLREVEINAKKFEGMITIHNGFLIRRILVYGYGDLAERKEIDNVSGESTIWKSGSIGVLKPKTAVQHEFLLNKPTWRIYRAKYQGSFSF
ncbi:hypothetical protein Tco_0290768 [Tanacetum coccineum]